MPRNNTNGLSPDQAREIAEECYGEVLAYCRRHAPAGHEAADLAQETFLRFVRVRGYRDRGKPIAYLMRIARSVCVDASRSKRLETVSLDFDIPEEGRQNQDDWELKTALAKLPDEMREVLELRYGTELSVNECARALGISRFSVRRRINAALKMLKEELREGDLDA